MPSVAVLVERAPRERRVALVPEEVVRLSASGLSVAVEAGAGVRAGYPDEAFRQAGASLKASAAEALEGADILVRVRPPATEEVAALRQGSVLVCMLPPAAHLDLVRALAEAKVTAFSFDLVPRTSRAQAVDALSSQASVAGYQGALVAAVKSGRMFPMMMTAAGTVPPAKVLVIGAGVAGLQAIATARRLGASVSAYDVRQEAAEEVRSLGASFLDLGLEARQGAGGYAAEQTADFLARQQEMLAEAVARSDALICTAAVPGRPAPKIVTQAMVEAMKPGAVIVDLAAASGGNCVLTVDGEEVVHAGVLVVGAGDLASEVATHASSLYARNVGNFLRLIVSEGRITLDNEDELVAAMKLTSGGEVAHRPTSELLEASEKAK